MMKKTENHWLLRLPGLSSPRRKCAGILLMLGVIALGNARPSRSGATEHSLKFAFFNIEEVEDYWWSNASKIMQAACDDFGIDLQVYYANLNQFLMIRQFEQAARRSDKPDVAIFASRKKNGAQMLTVAEETGINAFLFNAGLFDEERKQYGGPRESFTFWLGQILPDDEQAGYDLARTLFGQAKAQGFTDASGRLHVIGLEGIKSDMASAERKKGLMKAVREDPQIVLHQVAPASWDREKGKGVFLGLKSRYPDARVVWAANDPMGLGAIDGIKELDITPGQDMLVGSVDWIPDALEALQRGELSVSVGGHFMEAAWSVVLLYDYFHGTDFAEETLEFSSTMGILTQENIEAHLQNFGEGHWERVDFTQFSKTLNPEIDSYNFTFDAILQQMTQ